MFSRLPTVVRASIRCLVTQNAYRLTEEHIRVEIGIATC